MSGLARMQLPNILTLVRMPMTFAIVGLMYGRWPGAASLAFWLFIAAAVTDYYDGKLARERGIVSNFGRFMDALADKVVVLGIMIALLDLDYLRLPSVLVIMLILLVLTREFLVSGLRMMAATRGIVVAADMGGKVKTAIQMTALGFLLGEQMVARDALDFWPGFFRGLAEVAHWIGVGLFFVSMWFTVSSMWSYGRKYRHVLTEGPPR